ncbi:hypothetical protein BVC80_7963g4 [Macleaya cordata]|uniref:Uncharacterized protein n=1 Tax=Macleaya cordata TaxID=56857 RepID=A0A200QI86_MACCD|nr:hypothetical protein BVC80_7963g4 [Macleaya cordata]
MRGTTGLSRGKYVLKQINPIRQTSGMYATSVQKKGNNGTGEEGLIADNKTEPILAFNKPQLPPGLGPLIVYSLLEMGSDHDENDDKQ